MNTDDYQRTIDVQRRELRRGAWLKNDPQNVNKEDPLIYGFSPSHPLSSLLSLALSFPSLPLIYGFPPSHPFSSHSSSLFLLFPLSTGPLPLIQPLPILPLSFLSSPHLRVSSLSSSLFPFFLSVPSLPLIYGSPPSHPISSHSSSPFPLFPLSTGPLPLSALSSPHL